MVSHVWACVVNISGRLLYFPNNFGLLLVVIQLVNMENSKSIAKNTMFLYVRMLFLLFVALYTSRVVFEVLGIEDYGIYNVVPFRVLYY